MTGVSGDSLNVVPSEVTAYARRVYSIAEQLRSGLGTLDREVRGLQGTWRGSAADSYGAEWEQVRVGAAEVWESLFELAAKLGVTADTFQEADASFAGVFDQLDLPELT